MNDLPNRIETFLIQHGFEIVLAFAFFVFGAGLSYAVFAPSAIPKVRMHKQQQDFKPLDLSEDASFVEFEAEITPEIMGSVQLALHALFIRDCRVERRRFICSSQFNAYLANYRNAIDGGKLQNLLEKLDGTP